MKLRVLALVSEQRHVQIDTLLASLGTRVELKVIKIPNRKMSNLARALREIETQHFDRTILFLKFRYIRKQATFLNTLPGLVIRETDGTQDRLGDAKWYQAFTGFYRKLPAFRLLCSGNDLTHYFREKGIDAHFVPKCVDTLQLMDLQKERDIELGFIGRVSQKVYGERTRLMQSLQDKEGLVMLRTHNLDEYRAALNRIRIFVSADIGFSEYMYKNFEAMACGCLLLTHRQGKGEEEALGFLDRENVILYNDENELREKLAWLRSNPLEIDRIRKEGNRLIQTRWNFTRIGESIAELLEPPIVANHSFVQPWWRRLLSRN